MASDRKSVSVKELKLLEKLLRGEISQAVAGMQQENTTLRVILIGLVIVLFIGYAALLVSVIALVFGFLSNF